MNQDLKNSLEVQPIINRPDGLSNVVALGGSGQPIPLLSDVPHASRVLGDDKKDQPLKIDTKALEQKLINGENVREPQRVLDIRLAEQSNGFYKHTF
jgi:hypothetical protein